MLQKMWERPFWQGVWPNLDPWDVRLRTASTCWNVPGKYRPYGELLRKKELVASIEVCGKAQGVCADWSAPFGSRRRSWPSGRQSPDSGDMWRHGCPMSPEWISSCSTSETSCGEEYGHNNECRAFEVIGQDWSSEVVALFLEDWELGRVALSCHTAVDLLCQEMRDACWVSSESLSSPRSLCSQCQRSSPQELSQQQSLSLTVDGCDNNGEGCGVRNEGRRNVIGAYFFLSQVGLSVSFQF